jgi:hypothetical protein
MGRRVSPVLSLGVRRRDDLLLFPALSCCSAVRMALGSLISLAFWTTRLAGDVWPLAENLNHPSYIHWSEWPSFSLAVQLSSMPNRPKTTMDGEIGIDIIGEFS